MSQTSPYASPGIYTGVSWVDYQRIPAVNNSLLTRFSPTPAHARHYLDDPPPSTDDQRIGEALHALLLEPERFTREYAVAPVVDGRTKEGKATRAAWEVEHPNAVVVTEKEMALVQALADAALAFPTARDLLTCPGKSEVVVVAQDDEFGVLRKCRLDRIVPLAGWTFIPDLKTTSKPVTSGGFMATVANYSYHQQAAYYLDTLAVLQPADRRFVFIAIEKHDVTLEDWRAGRRPWALANCFELDPDAMRQGRDSYRAAMKKYVECQASGNWPAYPDGINGIGLPKWAYTQTED